MSENPPEIKLDLQPKQGIALLSRATEILFGGAAGGGKSHLMRVASIIWAMQIPGLQIYLFRRTSPDLIKNHIEGPSGYPVLLAGLINSGFVKYVQSPNLKFTFWNGSVIHLCHCQHEKNKYNYQGAEIHVLLIDELTHFSKSIYAYLRGRVRMVGVTLPPEYSEPLMLTQIDGGEGVYLDAYKNYKIFKIPKGLDFRKFGAEKSQVGEVFRPDKKVRLPQGAVVHQIHLPFPKVMCGTNPGGLGHNWVKSYWIDPKSDYEIWRAPKSDGGMLRQYIPALLEDNPRLLEEDPDYESRLEGLGSPDLVRAMRNGDWDIVAGGALDDVWQRARHIIKRVSVPAGWRIDRSFDYGSSKPFSVGWHAESDGETPLEGVGILPKGSIVRIGEWYGCKSGEHGIEPDVGLRLVSKEIAKGIILREKVLGIRGRVQPGPADSAIFDSGDDGISIAERLNEAAEEVLFVPADKRPGSRISGLEALRKLLKAVLDAYRDKEVPVYEDPVYLVMDNCRDGAIRTLPTLPRDENKPEDVDTASEDHCYDEIRYRVTHKRGKEVVPMAMTQIVGRPANIRYDILHTGTLVKSDDGALKVWQEPQVTVPCLICVCPRMTPLGADVIQVVEHRSGIQVAQWRGNVNPEELARLATIIGTRYNRGWVVCEREDQGLQVIEEMLRLKYFSLYSEMPYEPRIGTSQKTRTYGLRVARNLTPLIQSMAMLIRDGHHGILETETMVEMTSLTINESNEVEIIPGKSCERIVAKAMAAHVAGKIKPKAVAQAMGDVGAQAASSRGGKGWKGRV